MAKLNKLDLKFILDQIKTSEQHAAGTPLTQLIDDPLLSFGLRTVDGTFNNLLPGQEEFGASDNLFPRLLPLEYVGSNALDTVENDGDSFTVDTNGPAPGGSETLVDSNYSIRGTTPVSPGSFFVSGDVVDADPRTISNLITDQSSVNKAAVDTYNALNGLQPGDPGYQTVQPRLIPDPNSTTGGTIPNPDFVENLFVQNVAPDEGLSAPFNSWMTLFGQFFDHGLDLVSKGDNGTIYIPLQPDDPLYNPATPQTNFMAVTRVTTNAAGEATNTTTSWIDQNQTYTSHASHQAWLREYVLEGGRVVATGNLLEGATGGLATWADVKAQARNILGFDLNDFDIDKVPMLAADQYGRLLLDSNGKAQLVTGLGGDLTQDHILAGSDDSYVSGQPAALGGTPVSTASAVRFGHAFLDDINNSAVPFYDDDRNPNTPSIHATEDSDGVAGVNDGDRTTYDNELLDAHYITGDGRGNENIGLTAVHHIFHSEHNRQAEEIKHIILADAQEILVTTANQTEATAFLNEWLDVDVATVPASTAGLNWDGERIFQAARFATEMQYQHLVFEEFGRKVMPAINVFAGVQTDIDASIVAEFAHVVYRFGHSMLTETVDRIDANGNPVLEANNQQIGLIQAFLNPLEYASRETSAGAAAGEIVNGMTRQVGNEIDEFVTGALQNNLLGLPLDLGAINIARGRDAGIPSLNSARRQFFGMTGDSQLQAYTSWADFGENIKHPESLVNFIAAYGRHSSITGATTLADKRAAAMLLVNGNIDVNGDGIVDVAPADRVAFMNSTGAWANGANGVTTTGLDDVDFWIGGLAERQMPFGGLLGSTFGFVFETQMERLQDGDRLYYLARTAGLNFLSELEGNSFSELVMRNTPNVGHLPGDIFSTPNYILEVNQSLQFDYNTNDTNLHSDPVGQVVRNNPGTPGPDSNYLKFVGGEHVVLGGTNNNDILIADIGDDTVWGDDGNDRIEGGAGNDMLNGGDGDDIITDSFGDDNIKGGAGDDVITAGAGIDLIISGDGNDFVFAGPDDKETIAGAGTDFVYAGDGANTVFGDEGSDWIEGGAQADLLQGDAGDPFQISPIVGNDVIIGGTGNDDYDSETGDDILVNGDNIESTNDDGTERFEGMLGYDWVTFARDTSNDSTRADLEFTGLLPPTVEPLRDRFDLVEGLSGWNNNDTLRGDSLTSVELSAEDPAADNQNNALNNQAQINLIDGLQALLDGMLGDSDAGTAGFQSQTSFSGGNIILGGGGSDTIEGRGGNDLIDGDKWLNAQISYIDSNNVEQRVDSMSQIVDLMTSGALKPSQLKIVKEIITAPNGTAVDTAVYTRTNGTALATEYDVVENANGSWTVTHYQLDATGARIPDGTSPVGFTLGANGIDTLHNIEQIRFEDAGADGVFGDDPDTAVNESLDDIVTINPLVSTLVNDPASGTINITSSNPPGSVNEGVNLTAALAAVDADGINNASIRYDWQVETVPGNGNWVTIRYNSPSFNPDDGQVGKTLRVVATFEDGEGNQEQLFQTLIEAPNGVINVNDLPTARDTEVTATEDATLIFGIGNFGFSDPDAGDTLGSIVIDSLPIAGTFTLNGVPVALGDIVTAEQLNNQELRYLPTTDVNGPELVNFTFYVRDQNDVQSLAPKSVWINVEAGNDAPTGTDKTVTIAEDTSYTFTKGDFGFTDIDEGDDLRAVRINTLPTGGSLTLNNIAVALNQVVLVTAITANQLKYTPVADGNGYPAVDSQYTNFTFTVQDLAEQFADAANTMTINVTQVNDAATGALAISDLTPTEGTQISVSEVLGQPIADIDGLGTLTYQWQSSANGIDNWTVVAGATAATYTPTQAVVNRYLRVSVSFTDGDGNAELITSPATTSVVGDLYNGNNLANNPALTNGEDNASGNGGADIIRGLGGIDLLNGGAGNDNIDGGDGNDIIDGGLGSDILLGGDGDDTLIGGTDTGADTLVGGTGADAMSGGGGNDIYEVDNTGDTVTEALGGGTDAVETTLTSYTLGDNVENLNFTDVDPIAFTGTGNALNNRIEGGDGNDILDGGAGTDTLIGGLGDDTYIVDVGPGPTTGDLVTEAAGQGTDTVLSSATYTLNTNVEKLTLTGTTNINGTGNTLDNVLTGNTGNNTLDGGTGADTINGGAGNDTLIGGTGATIDTINGEAGDDTILYTIGQGADVVDGGDDTDTLTISGTTANDTLTVLYDGTKITRVSGGNVSNLEVVTANLLAGTADLLSYNGVGGTTANVTVNLATGNASGFAINSVVGVENVTTGSGNDSITGSLGAITLNTLSGGLGDDSYFVDGGETVSEAATSGTDTVFATLANGVGYTITDADVEHLTLLDTTNSNATGNASNNTLTGNTGNNVLLGLGGIDTLNGGDGNDDLTGGTANDIVNGEAGDDTIRYTMGDGADTIDGGANSDTLLVTGTAGNDVLDVVFDGSSITSLEGGSVAGIESIIANLQAQTTADTLSYGTATLADVTVNLAAGTASGFSSIASIENVTTGGGADTFIGNSGNNVLNGGAGVDTYDLSSLGGGVTISVSGANLSVVGGANIGTDTLTAIENIKGTTDSDVITTNGGANVIEGGSGDDTINAGAGNDVINGGAGNDNLTGGGALTSFDTFVFDTFVSGFAAFGTDSIQDFDAVGGGTLADQDKLDFRGTGLTSGDIGGRIIIATSGVNTTITVDGAPNVITLVGVATANVDASDFMFG